MYSRNTDLSRTLTFILAGGQGKRLAPFTSARAKPLIPFGGDFHIIDFALSNCVNCGLEQAYLLTQYKHDLIRKYVESSSWDTRFVCLPPRAPNCYRGTADSVYQNVDLIRSQNAEHVLILAADHVYRMDYRKLVRFHENHGGDATIAVVRYPRELAGELGVLEVDEGSQVVGLREKPEQSMASQSGSPTVLASMGVYVFRVPALTQILLRDAGKFGSSHEFGKDILPNLVRNVRVHAYDFSAEDEQLGNYWCDVGTIDSYHRAHMDLLIEDRPFDLYDDRAWPVYAAGKSVTPRDAASESPWKLDSIVSPQAQVGRATVFQSFISPFCEVAPGAEVQSSVLMPGVRLGRGARVRRVVVDEGVDIPAGERIGFDPAEDRERFLVTRNGVVVVPASKVTGFHRESA